MITLFRTDPSLRSGRIKGLAKVQRQLAKWRTGILACAMLVGICNEAAAQLNSANYSFSTHKTGSFAVDKNGVPYNMNVIGAGGSTTAIATSSTNQPENTSGFIPAFAGGSGIPIGFDFYFMGEKVTNFDVNTWGQVSFIKAGYANMLTTTSRVGTNPNYLVVSPLTLPNAGSNSGNTYASSFNSQEPGLSARVRVSTTTFGTAPNRVKVIDFLSVAYVTTFNSNTFNNWRAHVRLYESSNVIEFVYGNRVYTMTGASYYVGFSSSNVPGRMFLVGNISAPFSTGTFTTSTTGAITTNIFSSTGMTMLSSPGGNGARRTILFDPLTGTSNLSPTGLAISGTSSSANLTWVDAPNELSYVIYYSTNPNVPIDEVTSVRVTRPAGSTSATISGLTAGTPYYFKLFAVREALSAPATGTYTPSAGCALPVITCPANASISCTASSSPAALGSATATGAGSCTPTVTFSDAVTAGACAGTYSITRTWTATNTAGSVTCAQLINVVDNIGPVLSGVPADATVSCDAVPAAASVSATDNCSGATVSMTENTVSGSCTGNYTITRTWTALDGCGNASSATQTITVVDNTAPVLSGVPADATVSCDAVPAAASVSATDNCSGATVSMTENTVSGSCTGNYTITRTWIALDGCGNASSATQTITVVDNTAPSISCPANVTVSCDASTAPAATGLATASDNCGSAGVSYTDVANLSGCNSTGTITRTWTATDDCGNTSSCTQTITVIDNTAPSITCPANVTISCDASSAPSATGSATATDNCGTPAVTYSDASALTGCGGTGTITRTWTATDACGNASSCTQTITLVDVTAPSISCPAALSFNCLGEVPAADVSGVTASDNCSDAAVTWSGDTDNGATGCAGDPLVITRTYTATDDCGNASSCTQTITVEATPVTVNAGPNTTVVFGYPSPLNCATLTATGIGGGCSGPYSILWSTGETTASINVCPSVTTDYTVTVTNGNGCTGSDIVRVCVVDVRCGDGLKKISVCHVPPGNPGNAHTICIAYPAVNDHLMLHGDYLGACGAIYAICDDAAGSTAKSAEALESASITAYPNPFSTNTTVEFTLGSDDIASLKVYNVQGVQVATLFDGQVVGGQKISLEFSPANAASGIYFAKLVTESGEVKTVKLVLQK